MRTRKLATEFRLLQLRGIYRRLSPPAKDALARGAHNLSVGKRPPRLWVYVDDEGQVIGTETSANEM